MNNFSRLQNLVGSMALLILIERLSQGIWVYQRGRKPPYKDILHTKLILNEVILSNKCSEDRWTYSDMCSMS